MKTIFLGSRTSRLALAQAEIVKQAIESLALGVEIRIEGIRTTGDERQDINLSRPGPKISKGLFTKELEEALLRSEIDVAVHSLKDLPTDLMPELELVATLPRHDPVDLLISKSASALSEIPSGATVATSSPRRGWQIRRLRPDLAISDIRGNVPTRLRKLVNNDSWNSLVLARAGIERLGFQVSERFLDFEGRKLLVSCLREILPAPGQGAIGLEARKGDTEVAGLLGKINHPPTWFCTRVEREFLRMHGGGCSLPLGVYATLQESEMICEAIVFDEEGQPSSGSIAGRFTEPAAAAQALLKKIYEKRE